MGLFDWFRPSGRSGMVRTPVTADEVLAMPGFDHRRTFVCQNPGCRTEQGHPATLTIRAREPRASGQSNFHPHPPGHKLAGHSILPASLLNWAGLAEERGWKADPVQCPACRAGLTVAAYKDARRTVG